MSFAFESTLASRTFAPWLGELISAGFAVHMIYVWLRTPELAIRRVKARVKKGGHGIADEVVRRRYARSASNFVHLYKSLAEVSGTWRLYDNSREQAVLLARGGTRGTPIIDDPRTFADFLEIANGHHQEKADEIGG